MSELSHRLDRTVVIQAAPETVFLFITDSARWAKWWGAGSTIDAQPGGAVFIRYPNGVETSGEVLEVESPKRISFTYGYKSGTPIPPGASTVTIQLEPYGSGTRLNLTHAFGDPKVRDLHVQGWRFQLSVFANTVADAVHANPDALVDGWYHAWSLTGDAERRTAFAKIADLAVTFRDRYSCLDGIEDILAHVAASQVYMPGITLKRKGTARHCQGMVVSEWAAAGPDGKELISGTSVLTVDPGGRIHSVTGLVSPAM